MSADNWAKCPRCEEDRLNARAKFEKKIQQSYGKVSAEEYLRMTKEFKEPKPVEQTLREDYEIGIYDGGFFASYSGQDPPKQQ